jgi:hypothetical protein
VSFPDLTDLALGTCMSVLGESATYTPQGSSPLTINGIYSDRVFEIDPGLGTSVLTKKCLLEVQLSAFGIVAPKQFDTVVVRGVTYKVLEVDPDGAGAATLHLQKQ